MVLLLAARRPRRLWRDRSATTCAAARSPRRRRLLETSPSAEAAVVVAGLVEAERGAEAAEEAMAGAAALQRMKLEKRLAFLGTLGNNAPFIGLLGTVIGIVQAFDELGKAAKIAEPRKPRPTIAPQAVMTSIAEALVATAIGLFVAIPAVAAYNTFQRLTKSTLANTEVLSRILLAHLKAERRRGASKLMAGGVAGRRRRGHRRHQRHAARRHHARPAHHLHGRAKMVVSQSVPLDLPKAASGTDVQVVFSVELYANGDIVVDQKKLANDDGAAPARARGARQRAPICARSSRPTARFSTSASSTCSIS